MDIHCNHVWNVKKWKQPDCPFTRKSEINSSASQWNTVQQFGKNEIDQTQKDVPDIYLNGQKKQVLKQYGLYEQIFLKNK